MAVGSSMNTQRWAKLRAQNSVRTDAIARHLRTPFPACDARVQFGSVDPFAAVIFGAIAVIVVAVWLIGRYYPGSGLEQVGLRSAREIMETREALEAEDLEQMLSAHNARRRARGQSDVTADELELRVAAEQRDQESRREALLAERELDELLEATNRRRRARGLPERTREQAREEFGSGQPGAG
jgi:hypothetical protein